MAQKSGVQGFSFTEALSVCSWRQRQDQRPPQGPQPGAGMLQPELVREQPRLGSSARWSAAGQVHPPTLTAALLRPASSSSPGPDFQPAVD